jgi:hypothetical protein
MNSDQEKIPLKINNLSDQPTVSRRYTLAKVASGEIAIEQGSDGIFLRFDCDCIDALSVCQAQCCGLRGTTVLPEELEVTDFPVYFDEIVGAYVLARSSDGFCACLDRRTRMCAIYDQRPKTCRDFHCTRGADVRGWKIPNKVYRQDLM